MAIWTPEQAVRLAYEELLVAQEIPHFRFYDHTLGGLTTVRGQHTTSYSHVYSLCAWIKIAYPLEMPGLYVTSPDPLVGYLNKTIQSYGTSHAMHVWESDWNDYVKICHTKPEYWNASETIVSVLMKGFLWLEAFEVHCRTGRKIDDFSLTYR